MLREVHWGPDNGLLRLWKFQPGAEVKEGDVLASVEPVHFSLTSPISGTLIELKVSKNSKVESGYDEHIPPLISRPCPPMKPVNGR